MMLNGESNPKSGPEHSGKLPLPDKSQATPLTLGIFVDKFLKPYEITCETRTAKLPEGAESQAVHNLEGLILSICSTCCSPTQLKFQRRNFPNPKKRSGELPDASDSPTGKTREKPINFPEQLQRDYFVNKDEPSLINSGLIISHGLCQTCKDAMGANPWGFREQAENHFKVNNPAIYQATLPRTISPKNHSRHHHG